MQNEQPLIRPSFYLAFHIKMFIHQKVTFQIKYPRVLINSPKSNFLKKVSQILHLIFEFSMVFTTKKVAPNIP